VNTFKVKIGTFGDDDSADITVDGRVVGWLERVTSERFASATSRARVSFVSHYSIMLTDDFADGQLKKHDFASRAEAKLEVANAFERAWEQLSKPKPSAGRYQPLGDPNASCTGTYPDVDGTYADCGDYNCSRHVPAALVAKPKEVTS